MREPVDLYAAERAIDAVLSIQQVVKAVWTLARAQQPRVEAAASDASAYLDRVEELVERFARRSFEQTQGSPMWVVVGPERPFCGGLARQLIEQLPAEGSLLLVGRRLTEAVPPSGPIRDRVASSLPAAAGPEELDRCARQVAAALLDLAHAGPVGILHPKDGGSGLERTVLLAAGPLESERAPETYSASAVVLGTALQEAVSGRLVVALAEGLRSEVRARLQAADAARQSGEKRLASLRQRWRVLRQESITAELVELFAGRLSEPA